MSTHVKSGGSYIGPAIDIQIKQGGSWYQAQEGWVLTPSGWAKFYSKTLGIGYFVLGLGNAFGIEGINFGTETKYNTSTKYPISAHSGYSGANSNTAGYVTGGSTIAGSKTIFKHIFSPETTSQVSSTFSFDKSLMAATPSTTKMYIFGGYVANLTKYDIIEALLFSNDTTSVLTDVLSFRSSHQLGASSSTYAYVLWGIPENSGVIPTSYTSCNKMSFATETRTSFSTSSEVLYTGINNSQTNAYYSGNASTYPYTSTQIGKFSFSTETKSTVSATLATGRKDCHGVNSNTHGYFGGGVSGVTNINEIDGIIFSTETSNNPSITFVAPETSIATYQSGGYL